MSHRIFIRGGSIFLPVLLSLLALLAPLSAAQSQSELKVKAAFVFNITRYVEWPTPKNRLSLCVLGDGAVVETLKDELNGKLSDSRPITVIVSPPDEELRRCDLLYVAYSSGKKIQAVLQKTLALDTLTVGDGSSFANQGGIIGLVTVGDRIEMQINLGASQKANLKVSSRLLNLATVVDADREKRR